LAPAERSGDSIAFSFANMVWDPVIVPICDDISAGASGSPLV
jgi:hypothetical protein